MPSQLKRVAPKFDGIKRLLDDLEHRREEIVFCLCSAAVDYQIGWREAAQIFAHWNLVTIDNEQRICPVFVSPDLFKHRDRFRQLEDRPLSRVLSVQRILSDAFADYAPGRELVEQSEPIRRRLISAFIRLVVAGYLPESVAQTRFGHLGMVLLMREVFDSDAELSAFLQDPAACLPLPKSAEESIQDKLERELSRPPAEPEERLPLSPTEEILGLWDLLDRLEQSERPDAPKLLAQAQERLNSLLNPSTEELSRRFERHFTFDPEAAEKVLAEAKQLLDDDVDTSR